MTLPPTEKPTNAAAFALWRQYSMDFYEDGSLSINWTTRSTSESVMVSVKERPQAWRQCAIAYYPTQPTVTASDPTSL